MLTAGCTGWGTDGAGDNPGEEPNQSDNLENEQNNTSDESEDTSGTPLGSEGSSDTSDTESDDSDPPSTSLQSGDSDDSESASGDSDANAPDSSDGDTDAEHRSLTVTVTDTDGNPVEGVDVTATHEASGEERTLTTDGDGTVVFNVLDGEFALSAGGATESVTVDGDTETTLETDSDASGGDGDAPVENDEQQEDSDTDESDEETPDGDDPDEEPSEDPEEPEDPPEDPNDSEEPNETNDSNDSNESNETDDERTTLTVTLVDAETSESLDGEVQVYLEGYGTQLTRNTTDGTVTFDEDLPNTSEPGGDTYHVGLDANVDGYSTVEGITSPGSEISTGDDLDITMELVQDPEIHDVQFTVVDNRTGEPIEGASIEALGGRLPSGMDMMFGGETNANGEFSTTAAEHDSYELNIKAPGYLGVTPTISITDDTNRTIALESEHLQPPDEPNESNPPNESAV
ncbi:carboxypeptidase regulatory-like domain-containing protein [Halalkalicoccus subterraneus]|uniref:carboxypeptidase regulatory-like domain-containing protein n=1 Tax=Halalkalicoccus subterraneus TaxID=2675002 RepID=UPI0013CE41E6|nr:carboxypeptidase regulatory-like domain-containing protein [Halalkalicoccus subterraneus]